MKSFNPSSKKPDRYDLVGRIVAAYEGASPHAQSLLIKDLRTALEIISGRAVGKSAEFQARWRN
jgi:hypothetical protein